MKLAWYTPYSLPSAVGRFSALVVAELARQGIDVVVVRSEIPTPDLRRSGAHPAPGPVRWAADCGVGHDGVDLVVHNVGDHHGNHAFSFRDLRRRPGIVILHDVSLHGALLGLAGAGGDAAPDYEAVLRAECGDGALHRFRQSRDTDPRAWWYEAVADHPVLRFALRDASGIVTHSRYAAAIVAPRVAAPLTTIPLAYDGPAVALPAPRLAAPLRLLTIGNVNPNKRVGDVIAALAGDAALAARCEYRVVGAIEDAVRADLVARSAASGVALTVTGPVDAAALGAELAAADVVICLRRPSLEGASASVIEGMLSGRPVIVSDIGCFAEIPGRLVAKVAPGREPADLRRELHAIVAAPDAARARGAAARAWALEHHAPARYARRVVEFCSTVLATEPLLDTVGRIAGCLGGWGVVPDAVLGGRIDTLLAGFFAAGRDG